MRSWTMRESSEENVRDLHGSFRRTMKGHVDESRVRRERQLGGMMVLTHVKGMR